MSNGRPEPRVRKDGRCTQCKGERQERAVKDGDPFCKTECCKDYFGIEHYHGKGGAHVDEA